MLVGRNVAWCSKVLLPHTRTHTRHINDWLVRVVYIGRACNTHTQTIWVHRDVRDLSSSWTVHVFVCVFDLELELAYGKLISQPNDCSQQRQAVMFTLARESRDARVALYLVLLVKKICNKKIVFVDRFTNIVRLLIIDNVRSTTTTTIMMSERWYIIIIYK